MNQLFVNARIYPQTSDGTAACMAVSNGKILYVGNDTQQAEAGMKSPFEIIDLQGSCVLPGLIDSHSHPSCIALTQWRVSLHARSLPELLEEIRTYCRKHPVEEVPYFFAQDFQLSWFDENGPRKELLDQYVSDRPVRIQDFTDHSCWYNSKALELMGIVKGRPDPEEIKNTNGEIIRDETGEPTGWVREIPEDELDQILYRKLNWYPEQEPTEENIMPFIRMMNSFGVIAIMDGITEEATLKIFAGMDREGRMPLFYEGAVLLNEYACLEETIQEAFRLKQLYESAHVKVHTVKFFLDGTNELGNMASLEPLCTDPTGTDYGHMNMSEEELTAAMVRLNEAGLDLHMHIVGDRAFRTACNAMEAAKKICGRNWHIDVTAAHCELTHPDDRARPAELGMRINWSCHWAGGYFGEKARDYLGPNRFDTMYDFTEMLETGASVAFSSDVFSYKEARRAAPFFGMQVSASRIDPEYPLPEERFAGHIRPPYSAALKIEDLIRGYTASGAGQMRLDDRIGTLEKGKDATFIVTDRDPYQLPSEELSRVSVKSVYFEGKIIYSKEEIEQ